MAMRNNVTVLAAALLLASFGIAQAQTPPTKPLPPTTPSTGIFDFGYRGTSTDGDAARYERFRDLRSGATTFFEMGKTTNRYQLTALAANVGYHDQRYELGYTNAKSSFSFLWDSIPTNFSYLTSTPWTHAGNGVLTLDDNAQKAVEAKTAVGVPCAPGAPPAACANPAAAALALANRSIYVGLAKPFDMQMRRDAAGVEFTHALNQALGLNLGFTSTKKSGTQPWAASFAFNNYNEVALPLDNRTNDVNAGMEWANKKGMIRVSYEGSNFNNNIQSLTWDNPIRFTDFNNGLLPPLGPYDPSGYSNGNGPARGQMALAPSNTMYAFGVTGLYKMPGHTSVNGIVRMIDMSSNEALLPWSTNSSINTPSVIAAFPHLAHLPRDTAEAKVKGLNAMFNLNSRPTKMLALQARYRYNKHDNQTPHFPAEEYVRFDSVPEETGGETEQFDVTNNTFDATATLSAMAMAFRVGYGYDSFDRTGRSFANMTDNRFRFSVDTLSTRYLTLRAGYDYLQRRGDGFSESAIEDGGAQPGLRFYDEADRNSHRTHLIATVTPTDAVSLSFTMGTGREEYLGDGHEFGLLSADVDDYTVALDFAPSERIGFGASFGRNEFSSLQKARNANPPPDPTWTDPLRDWTLDNVEKVNSATVYMDVMKLAKDGNLRVSYDYNDSDNKYGFGGPRIASLTAANTFVPLPAITNEWQRFTVDYKVFLANHFGIGVSYWYEDFAVRDFNTIDTNGPVGFKEATGTPRIDYLGGLTTGYGNRPYTGQTGFVRVLYRF
jgi:MtrB/PioB family decaheme-associated outer membrane protein